MILNLKMFKEALKIEIIMKIKTVKTTKVNKSNDSEDDNSKK